MMKTKRKMQRFGNTFMKISRDLKKHHFRSSTSEGGGGRGQQRSALRPFLTSALALRPFLTSPLSAQTLSFRSALHPFAISAQRSYLILDRRSALKTFISFQRSALKAIFQNRSALKDPPAPPLHFFRSPCLTSRKPSRRLFLGPHLNF